ncbi:hypothetical protein [Modestobacter versicolor]|uniref:hypothetical protein n=1 Tax=Modestobacter versicolor TaxID=429133 RepID=UPI0034DDF5CE
MRSGGALRTLVTVVLALAVNLVLDVAFDLTVPARWAVVVGVVLVADLAVQAVRRRGAGPERARDGTSGGAHGRSATRSVDVGPLSAAQPPGQAAPERQGGPGER